MYVLLVYSHIQSNTIGYNKNESPAILYSCPNCHLAVEASDFFLTIPRVYTKIRSYFKETYVLSKDDLPFVESFHCQNFLHLRFHFYYSIHYISSLYMTGLPCFLSRLNRRNFWLSSILSCTIIM